MGLFERANEDRANSMGLLGENCEGGAGAHSTNPFRTDIPQEDFDREFYGRILKRSDSNTDVVRRQAELLSRHGDYEDALRLDRVLTKRNPNDSVAHYNLSCSLSMNGKLNAAVKALGKAIELGYCDFAHILADPDLDPLRELASFAELMRRQIPDDVPPRIA